MREAYFTICSSNYLPYARTLYASLRQAGILAPFYLFLVDRVADRFDVAALGFPCIESDRLDLPNHFDMAARYTVMEMNTAVKPFCIEWLFDQADAEAVIYLDPDIYVLQPLDAVLALLRSGANAVLTPHSTAPLDDGGDPDDLRILRTGTYNLGFGAFRRSPETRDLIAWWGRQLLGSCVVDLDRGLFVDQKFMDLAPSYLADTVVLRQAGYNVAYWNLIHRPVTRDDAGTWHAGGEVLCFFHFSGVVPGDRTVFSKHQDRFTPEDIGPLSVLLDEYLRGLERYARLGKVQLGRLPYHYGNLSNGLAFTDDMRQVYARAYKPAPRMYEDCFSPDLNLYCTLAPNVAQNAGAPISRLLHMIWHRRSDVRAAFPLDRADGRLGLAKWFLNTGYIEHNVPAPIVAAYRRNVAGLTRLPQSTSTVGAKGLSIYGYFRTESGIGTGARGNWRAAQAAGVASEALLLTSAAFENRLDTGIPLATGAPRHRCVLLHVNADEVRQIETLVDPERLAGRYRIGYWAWELAQFPAEWESAYNAVDEIWVPSRFVARAVGQRTRKPVRVIPHPVPLPPVDVSSTIQLRQRFGIPADRFAFLTAFDFNSYLARKNPIAVLRSFQAAFPRTGSSSPVLVVKCHGRPMRDRHYQELMATLQAMPHVLLIKEVMQAADVLALQSCCDAFVSLHRSEGFGLWVAECMALGKPVVTTNYGGTTDFALPENSFPIGFSMIAVGSDAYPFGAGQWWAEPNQDEAVAALTTIVESSSVRHAIGAAARNYVAGALSDARVGAILAERLAEAQS